MRNGIRTMIWVAALLGAVTSQAGTWRVEQDGSGDFATLQPAVDAAASGDTILIGPGDYVEMTTVTSQSGYEIEAFAYWNEAKDLVIVGAGNDVVRLGPDEYAPSGIAPSPAGIWSEDPNHLVVSGVAFRNLYWAIVNNDDTSISGCTFDVGDVGVYRDGGNGNTVECRFSNFHYACQYFACDTVMVSECTLENARLYFGQTALGVVENCTVNAGGSAKYYQSSGRVTGVEAICNDLSGVVCAWSQVEVSGSRITGGSTSIDCVGAGAFVEAHDNMFAYPDNWHFNMENYASLHAWHNEFYRESLGPQYFLKCFFYDIPSDAFIDVGGNYWGPLDSSEHFLNLRIWDGNDDPDLKIIVDFLPIETEPLPTEKKSLGGFKSMFR